MVAADVELISSTNFQAGELFDYIVEKGRLLEEEAFSKSHLEWNTAIAIWWCTGISSQRTCCWTAR